MVDHIHPEFHAEVLNGRVLTSRLRPDSFEAASQARRKYDFVPNILLVDMQPGLDAECYG